MAGRADRDEAVVAVLSADLFFPEAHSLKEKRRRLVSLLDRLRAGFPVSVAETGFHDLHQRGRIAVALVTTDERHAQSMIDRMTDRIGADGETELLSRRVEFIRLSDQEEEAP